MNQLSLFRDPPPLAWPGCQLAERFCPEKVTFPVWVEEKLDGMRGLIIVDESGQGSAWSREGRRLACVQYIADQVAGAMGPGVVVDGELFAGTWSNTIHLVKTRGAVDRSGLALHAFDCLTAGEWTRGRSEASLEARRERLQALRGVPAVEVVQGLLVNSLEELQAAFAGVIAAGGEGIMLKDPAAGYSCNRSWSWQKLKEGRPECW